MNWKPTEDLFVEFSDETGGTSVQEVEEMIARMRAIANEFGFDLSTFGNQDSTRTYLNGVQEILDRHKSDDESV